MIPSALILPRCKKLGSKELNKLISSKYPTKDYRSKYFYAVKGDKEKQFGWFLVTGEGVKIKYLGFSWDEVEFKLTGERTNDTGS